MDVASQDGSVLYRNPFRGMNMNEEMPDEEESVELLDLCRELAVIPKNALGLPRKPTWASTRAEVAWEGDTSLEMAVLRNTLVDCASSTAALVLTGDSLEMLTPTPELAIHGKLERELEILDSKSREVHFCLTELGTPTCHVKLCHRDKVKEPIAFRLETNPPDRFVIRPQWGILAPGDSISVSISLNESHKGPLLINYQRLWEVALIKSKDAILIQTRKVASQNLTVEEGNEDVYQRTWLDNDSTTSTTQEPQTWNSLLYVRYVPNPTVEPPAGCWNDCFCCNDCTPCCQDLPLAVERECPIPDQAIRGTYASVDDRNMSLQVCRSHGLTGMLMYFRGLPFGPFIGCSCSSCCHPSPNRHLLFCVPLFFPWFFVDVRFPTEGAMYIFPFGCQQVQDTGLALKSDSAMYTPRAGAMDYRLIQSSVADAEGGHVAALNEIDRE